MLGVVLMPFVAVVIAVLVLLIEMCLFGPVPTLFPHPRRRLRRVANRGRTFGDGAEERP